MCVMVPVLPLSPWSGRHNNIVAALRCIAISVLSTRLKERRSPSPHVGSSMDGEETLLSTHQRISRSHLRYVFKDESFTVYSGLTDVLVKRNAPITEIKVLQIYLMDSQGVMPI